jgi:hypothetical protein
MTGTLATHLRRQRPRKPRRVSHDEHFVESDSPATIFLATSEGGKPRTRQAPGRATPPTVVMNPWIVVDHVDT